MGTVRRGQEGSGSGFHVVIDAIVLSVSNGLWEIFGTSTN